MRRSLGCDAIGLHGPCLQTRGHDGPHLRPELVWHEWSDDGTIPGAVLACFVEGKPIGQGRVSYNRSGHGYHANGKVLHPWRAAIAGACREQYSGEPLAVAVTVELAFRFRRPKSATRPYPTVSPDVDHLVRAVLDAMTGTVLVDDKWVVDVSASQRYALPGEAEGVGIVVRLLDRVNR